MGLNIVILLFMIGSTITSKSLGDGRLREELKNYTLLYDWSHEKINPHIVRATKFWDTLQHTAHCCGLTGPQDWDDIRPVEVPHDQYPASCCVTFNIDDPASSPKCKESTPVASAGCPVEFRDEEVHLTVYSLFLLADFVLCIIAFIVGQVKHISDTLKQLW